MKFYYFCSTHWDREWYRPLETFRTWLLKLFDHTATLLENDPEFRKFTFDGQTVVLEDILAVRPEWRDRILNLTRSGRLNVGPWYVMPDEFLCSAEALIRNLQIGRDLAHEFECEPWPIGYVCDIFGHIARLPQLMRGFGMEGIVVWRGTSGDMPAFQEWRSPDGSRLPVMRLFPNNGYCDFGLAVRGWSRELPLRREEFLERMRAWMEKERAYWGDETLVLSDAFDHCEPCTETGKFLQWIREEYPDAELVWSDYRDVFAALKKTGAELPPLEGELTCTRRLAATGTVRIAGTLSSRFDIKRANDDCQNRLERLLEPVLAAEIAAKTDVSDGLALLKYAWKHLVRNHAHDSICGCSTDAVHRAMLVRFDEVRDLCSEWIEEFLRADRSACMERDFASLVCSLASGNPVVEEADPEGRYCVRLYNPLPYRVERVMEFVLPFPACVKYPKTQVEPFGCEHRNSFEIRDAKGREIPYALRRIRRDSTRIFYRQDARSYDCYEVSAKVDLAPGAWTTLDVVPTDAPVRYYGAMRTGATSASNGKVALEIHSDGTFTLRDLLRGRDYPGQNRFAFEREIGDGWGHVVPTGAECGGGGGTAQIALVCDSPDRISFRIERSWLLSREIVARATYTENFSEYAESPERVEFRVSSVVSLDSGADAVDVQTTVDNHIRDIQVQLRVPTTIVGGGFASQPFGFVPRSDGRPSRRASERYLEQEPTGENFNAVIGKRDARGGLAFLSEGGLHEGGCAGEEAPGEMLVTLFRAFRRTFQTDGETDGELNKTLTFHYALRAFGPETGANALFREAQELSLILPCGLLRASAVRERAAKSFLAIDTPAVVSALKPAWDGNGVIVRLLNCDDESVNATLSGSFTAAQTCDLAERTEADLQLEQGRLHCVLRGGEGLTLRLKF